MKRLVAAAWLACTLPAFGQDLREQLIAPLHAACVADVEQALMRVLHTKVSAPIDGAKFCACADEGIRTDRILDAVAKLPESNRAPSSKPAVALEYGYFSDGYQCYSKSAARAERPLPDKEGRPLEEVRQGLERLKGVVYQAYNRALKSDPWLSGKVVFEFAIEPDGQVSAVNVVSSDLQDENLLAELKSRFLAMKFPAEPVPKLVTKYPIDFRPM
jgi:hypothetical protein